MPHRLAYECLHGKIGKGLCACHKCDVRNCCNPDHIWIGTPKQNSMDMVLKGRSAHAIGELHSLVKLKEYEVHQIIDLVKDGRLLQREIGELYGVTQVNVSRIYLGKSWKHLGIGLRC